MELYQLKSFLTIAHEQNLTRAAEALHLSQSALSSQIKLLEEELSVQLFKRTSRGMAITDNGRILMTHAQDVLEAAGQMQQRAAALSRGISATVSIGLNTDPTFLRVSAINQRLRLLHANTNVILHICQSIDTPQQLRHGQIDLGFFYGNNQETEIEHVVISQVRICVVIPNNLKPADRSLIGKGSPNCRGFGSTIISRSLRFYNTGFRTTEPCLTRQLPRVDEQIVRELVAAGQGLQSCVRMRRARLVESGQVTIWSKGWGEIPLCLGWLASRRQEKNIKEAREVVNYVWQKPESVTDGSLADKCWV